MHEYFYGAQSSTYSFIRVPTVLFTDDQYKYVSAEAKVLYGLLLARMDLSAKNGWLDDQGRVYIICTLSEIMEKLNCADNKATKLMNELEDKCGLIERKRQGLGKPNLIYVKNFLSVDNAVESRFKSRDNHDSGVAEITIPDTSKSRPSNKDQKYIDLRYTENPIYPGWDTDGMSEYERYKEWFRRQLEIDILILDHPTEKETLEGILDILAETCNSNKKEIRIAGDDKPKEVVKSRLMKLDSMHKYAGKTPAQHRQRSVSLIIDIQKKCQEKGPGYQQWAKVHNVKQLAQSVYLMRERGCRTISELSVRADDQIKKRDDLLASIKASEARMAEIATLKKHIINYSKTRKTYEEYRKAGYSKKFFEAHREEITLHKAAKQAFDDLGVKKIPKVKDLNTEYAELLAKKKAAYPEYRRIKEDAQELLIAKMNIESFYEADQKVSQEHQRQGKQH